MTVSAKVKSKVNVKVKVKATLNKMMLPSTHAPKVAAAAMHGWRVVLRAVPLPLPLPLLLLLPIPMLHGCDDELDLRARPAAVRQAPKASAASTTAASSAALSTPVDTQTYNYSGFGKRDPFRSYLDVVKTNGVDESSREVEVTERYALRQYRLTGLVTGSSQPHALIEDPLGQGHIVKLGSRLGKNGGRITRITSDGITVLEEHTDPQGRRIRVPATLELPKPDMEEALSIVPK